MASAKPSAAVLKNVSNPKSTSDKVSQILAALNRHGDQEGNVIVFLPGWQEMCQMQKALKKQVSVDKMMLHMDVIGNNDEDIIETPEDDDRVVVLSTIIGTRSVTLPKNDSAENDSTDPGGRH